MTPTRIASSSRLARLGAGGLLACLLLVACQPGTPSSGATFVPGGASPASSAGAGGSAVPSGGPGAASPTAGGAAASGGTGATAAPSASAILTITTPVPSPTPTVRITAAPTPLSTAPAIIQYDAPATVKCAGTEVVYITLTWRVDRATGVSLAIDGPGKYADYPASFSVEVPFSCGESQHTYKITSTGGSGPAATQTKTIKKG